MKKVVLSSDVENALRTLDTDGVRRMNAWFSYLERWDTDEVVRRNSAPLQQMPGVYVLRTTTDLRIFFRVDGDTVTVLDIAKEATILASGHVSRGQLMASVLESIVFDPVKFQQELEAFNVLLKSEAELSEMKDIRPFFKRNNHLTAYLGTVALNIGVATEICFEYEFFGDFKADILLGSKHEKEFCVVEFEDGEQNTIFKKQKNRKNPEWSARFEHAFSQITDWFYNLEDFKNTQGFAATFGPGHTSFSGLLVMGRSASLDDTQKSRLKWRTDTVSIGKHKVICITFDELHAGLRRKFDLYSAVSKVGTMTEAPGLPPPQDNT